MITLEINPVVLTELRSAFPKPANCADKALEKYRVLLECLLFKAIQRGRSVYEMRFDLYSVPVSDLSHKGPQLGYGKKRLHSWLKDNQLELIRNVETGSNLSGLVSKIKLTELVTIQDGTSELGKKLKKATTTTEIEKILTASTSENGRLFGALFPDYFSYLTDQQRLQVFDVAPIDISSLQAYIVWINTKATKFGRATIETHTRQAKLIHDVAKYTNGWFPMRKQPSDFGRMYYGGISVQNVNKTLRRAMLGDCWEYDVRAAVITWKLTFAEELAKSLEPNKNWRSVFWASLLYVENRKEFMRDVRAATFGKDSDMTVERQDSLIKQTVTAIGFGARVNGNGWRAEDGTWANPSIMSILTNKDERDHFLECPVIRQFIQDQTMLDKYLEEGMKNEIPELYWGPLITADKKPSRSKAVAYMYQHQETEAMNIARRVLRKHGIAPIANIHDAFIVRRKLSVDVLYEIIDEMRTGMANDLFTIKGSKLEGFAI
jgi:hypothetical protein